jgi:hypothetical protein
MLWAVVCGLWVTLAIVVTAHTSTRMMRVRRWGRYYSTLLYLHHSVMGQTNDAGGHYVPAVALLCFASSGMYVTQESCCCCCCCCRVPLERRHQDGKGCPCCGSTFSLLVVLITMPCFFPPRGVEGGVIGMVWYKNWVPQHGGWWMDGGRCCTG